MERVNVNWIVTSPPVITHDYTDAGADRTSIVITVTTTVYGTEVGNALAELKWARGSYAAADFAGGTLGQDMMASGAFTVTSNGTYTIYARDIAGNEAVATVTVSRILAKSSSDSGGPTCPVAFCIQLAPGEGARYEVDGLTLIIPPNATKEAMTIALQDITSSFAAEERLIGRVYEITKSVEGRFLLPVTFEFRYDPGALGNQRRPAIFYYDEGEERWIELDGTKVTEDGIVQGVTDHFTKFAVLAVQNEATDPDRDTPRAAFSDIDGHWAQSSIVQAVRAGFVSGYADGTFQPDRVVTRAEFTVMLAKALRLGEGGETTFPDEDTIPAWARQHVAAAVASGILSGYADGTFRPQGRIIRAEMAVMAARSAALPPSIGAETRFADNASIPAWSKPYAAAAYEAGLIQGKGGNRFAPMDSLTRAEAVVVLLGIIDA